jgi:transposase
VSLAPAGAHHAAGLTRSSQTRPTAPAASAPACADAASGTPSRKFDRQIYRQRNIVERCFNRLKGFRGIATRYEKTATSYQAAVTLASFLLWARSV